LIDSFQQSAYFNILKRVESPKELYQAIDKGKAKTGLLIPPNFTKDVLSGKGAKLQLLIDGSDSTPANVAMNSSQAIVSNFMQREGLIPINVLPIDFRPRLWYNPDLKSSFFMIPGLIGLLLQMIIPMITASAIVREKERGNIEQLLVTPIKSYELMIGKLVPYIFIGMFIATVVIATAKYTVSHSYPGKYLYADAADIFISDRLFGNWTFSLNRRQYSAGSFPYGHVFYCAIDSVVRFYFSQRNHAGVCLWIESFYSTDVFCGYCPGDYFKRTWA